MADLRLAGIGMTSARTRDRLVQRLREQGITNAAVLERIRNVPRHIFVDEALGSRAYEDTALPIGFGQTISQLKVGGRLVVPIGPEGEQQLVRFTRREQRVDREPLGAVAFVPLLGGTT